MVGQRRDAGYTADVTRALGRGSNEHLRAGNDLEAGRVMLAHPGLVIIQSIEVLEQLHVAVERQQRILAQSVEGREKYAGLEIPVIQDVHGAAISSYRWTDGSVRSPI